MSTDDAHRPEIDPAGDRVPVTLQVSASPMDLPHLRDVFPHQVRQFGRQVDEILMVLDMNKPATVEESAWVAGSEGIREVAASLIESFPYLKVVAVDRSPAVGAKLAAEFFGGKAVPDNDFRGGAIYPFLFGLAVAQNRYVLHFDSDMMFGGGSQSWVAEGVALLQARPDVLLCSPLPGPPRADGKLTTQTLDSEPYDSLAFRTQQMSWRVFLIDRQRFQDRIGAIELRKSRGKDLLLAYLDGYPPYQTVEAMLSSSIAANGLARVDFLGSGDGMWSLHPPYRSALFYNRLPWLIKSIETGEVADEQRGDYDVNDSMIDWGDVRHTKRRRLRWHLNRVRQRLGR